jgi:DNA-binding transcriptional LysR family regulator
MDQISDIFLFARVVASGNLSAAARDIGLSTAAISKRLIRLEERLGVQLLKRTTRGASPTEEGTTYYERCVRILSDIEEAESEISGLDTMPNGLLKVMASISFGRQHIAVHLAEFLDRYPKIHIDLRLTAQAVDFVSQQCDLWIRIGEPEDSRLIARKLAPTYRIICASPEYLKQYGEPQTVQELKNHNCLIIDQPNTRAEQWHFIGPNGPESVRVSGSVRSNDGDVIKHCVLAGVGIAVKASWDIAQQLQDGSLCQILKNYAPPVTNIYALSLQSRHRAGRVRAFIDFLLEKYDSSPYFDKI